MTPTRGLSLCSQGARATTRIAASDTFAGVRPTDARGFIVAQLAGAAATPSFSRWRGRGTA
jgi:hypothetical protein